jgi:1,4-alpha-glucan branching enzyme
LFASALAAAVIVLLLFLPSQVTTSTPYRFVIYRPDVSRMEITGSFTAWQRVPMNRVESSGYWEATLDLTQGEHRFTYILDGRQSFPDPTVLTRERDDFGGENSILLVGL